MADNQLLLKKNADEGFFADDDPLAELARIVGFEPSTENQVRPATVRREPEFDLEDELLKEFEQYDAPVRHDAPEHYEAPEQIEASQEPEVAAPELPVEQYFVAPVEPEPVYVAETIEEIAPAEDVAPAYVAPAIERPILEAVTAAPIIADPVRPASHPVFELEDEILREFAAFDARRPSQAAEAPPPQGADLIDQLIAEIVPQPVVPAEVESEPVALPTLQNDESVADTVRLADQPEDADFADQWQEDNQVAETSTAAAAAPFGSDFDEFMGEPVHVEADFSAEQGWDDTATTPAGHDDATAVADEHFHKNEEFEADRDAAAARVVAEPEAIATPSVEPVHEHVRDRDYGLDELLGEVERYPVGGPVMQWPRSTPTLVEPKATVSPEPEVAAPVAAEPELSQLSHLSSQLPSLPRRKKPHPSPRMFTPTKPLTKVHLSWTSARLNLISSKSKP
jgi:hypothetical protein